MKIQRWMLNLEMSYNLLLPVKNYFKFFLGQKYFFNNF